MRTTTARLITHALLAVLGAVVAVAGAVVQGGWFPFGLLLGVAGTAALFLGGARLTGTRAGAGVPAVAWLAAVIALSMTRAEGDAVFAADASPYIYLMAGALAGVICATLPTPPGGRPPGVPPRRR